MRVCLLTLCITIFLITSSVAQEVSLGNIARETKTRASSSTQHAKIVTDDDVVSTAPAASPNAQQFCTYLKERKEPGADRACQVLSIDMGPEYESTENRYLTLAKQVCEASHGQFPSTKPLEPQLASQWQEVSDLFKKMQAMWNAEQTSYNRAVASVADNQQEQWREMERAVPGWKDRATAGTLNEDEKRRIATIARKYGTAPVTRSAGDQTRLRMERAYYDMVRMAQPCGHP